MRRLTGHGVPNKTRADLQDSAEAAACKGLGILDALLDLLNREVSEAETGISGGRGRGRRLLGRLKAPVRFLQGRLDALMVFISHVIVWRQRQRASGRLRKYEHLSASQIGIRWLKPLGLDPWKPVT